MNKYYAAVNRRYYNDPEFRLRKIMHSQRRWQAKKNDPTFKRGCMWRSARLRARRAGLPFNITVDDIVIPKRCPILNVPLGEVGGLHAPALDRINNKRGYVKGNVAVISKLANSMKGCMSVKDVQRLLSYMRGFPAS